MILIVSVKINVGRGQYLMNMEIGIANLVGKQTILFRFLKEVQCKCYKENNKVNDTEITKFAHGLKNVNGISRGIFITTSDYTPQAKKVVEELKDIKIILINGYKLAKYMREYEVGVKVLETRNIYDIII